MDNRPKKGHKKIPPNFKQVWRGVSATYSGVTIQPAITLFFYMVGVRLENL